MRPIPITQSQSQSQSHSQSQSQSQSPPQAAQSMHDDDGKSSRRTRGMLAQRAYRKRHASKFKTLQEDNERLRKALTDILSAAPESIPPSDLGRAIDGARQALNMTEERGSSPSACSCNKDKDRENESDDRPPDLANMSLACHLSTVFTPGPSLRDGHVRWLVPSLRDSPVFSSLTGDPNGAVLPHCPIPTPPPISNPWLRNPQQVEAYVRQHLTEGEMARVEACMRTVGPMAGMVRGAGGEEIRVSAGDRAATEGFMDNMGNNVACLMPEGPRWGAVFVAMAVGLLVKNLRGEDANVEE